MLYRELIQYRALIIFDSLTQAMAAEKVVKKLDCPYALIPTPKSMRSGCNNAICFPLHLKDIIEDLSNRKTPTSTSGSGSPVLCFGGGV